MTVNASNNKQITIAINSTPGANIEENLDTSQIKPKQPLTGIAEVKKH